MEKSIEDLLSDAFSAAGASFPTLSDEDWDFKSSSFDEMLAENNTCRSQDVARANKNKALHQEVADRAADLSDAQTEDATVAKDSPDIEYSWRLGLKGQTHENYRTLNGDPEEEGESEDEEEDSEEQEEHGDEERDKEVGEDAIKEEKEVEDREELETEEEKMGSRSEQGPLMMATCWGSDFFDGDIEDRTSSEGTPLALEGSGNEEQAGDSDEGLSYFEKVPEHSSAARIKGDGAEGGELQREREKQEESKSKDMKREEGHALSLRFDQEDDMKIDTDLVDLKSLDIGPAAQNLQGLTNNNGDGVEKIRDFVGEEHQEAGESFADYPSDFSSFEYEEGGRKSPTVAPWENTWGLKDRRDLRYEEGAEGDDEDEERVENRISSVSERSGEREAKEVVVEEEEVDEEEEKEQEQEEQEQDEDEGVGLLEHSFRDAVAIGRERGESDSYTSSEDEAMLNRSEDELDVSQQEPEELSELNRSTTDAFARWSSSEVSAGFNLSSNIDTLTLQTRLLDNQALCTTLVGTMWPVVTQGSVDDGVFSNNEPAETASTGRLEEEEHEEERNWELEQERIKAFFEFYDDSDGENGNEERLTKVQFRNESLSQVIHYETNSDEGSLSSSTDGEEQISSAETSEDVKKDENRLEVKPAWDPLKIQQPEVEPVMHTIETCTRKRQCFNMLSATLKTGAITVIGLLMIWVADRSGWLSGLSFF